MKQEQVVATEQYPFKFFLSERYSISQVFELIHMMYHQLFANRNIYPPSTGEFAWQLRDLISREYIAYAILRPDYRPESDFACMWFDDIRDIYKEEEFGEVQEMVEYITDGSFMLPQDPVLEQSFRDDVHWVLDRSSMFHIHYETDFRTWLHMKDSDYFSGKLPELEQIMFHSPVVEVW